MVARTSRLLKVGIIVPFGYINRRDAGGRAGLSSELRARFWPDLDQKGETMANAKEAASKAMQIDGALGVAIVDSTSGMMLGAQGGGPIDLELAAAGNTEVVRAKRKTMGALKLTDAIEDILITLES